MCMRPSFVSRFIGRQTIFSEIREQIIHGIRLITISGHTGVGKTRLAAELCHWFEASTEMPVHWVSLSTIEENGALWQELAASLGLSEQPGQSMRQMILDALLDRSALFILDNCEQLIPSVRDLAKDLLRQSRGIQILVTSQQALGLQGEKRFVLPPLSLHASNKEESEAMLMFEDRAKAQLHDFSLTEENHPAISRICQRLDGLPLAIELAASRIGVLTAEQISKRLDDQFSLLDPTNRAGSADVTINKAINWSYSLLSPSSKILFRNVSVFDGGFDMEAAEAVCADGGMSSNKVLDQVTKLVDHSLLLADTVENDQVRFRMLQIVKAFAFHELESTANKNPSGSTKLVELRNRHLNYFRQKSQKIAPKLSGANQRLWFKRLDLDIDNFRAALKWSLNAGRIEEGMQLALALGQYWIQRRYLGEGQRWLESLDEAASDAIPMELRLGSAAFASFCASLRLNAEAAQHFGKRAVELAKSTEDPYLNLIAAASYGGYFAVIGKNDRAYSLVKKALKLAHQINDPFNIGMASFNLAIHAMALDKYDEAQTLIQESLNNASSAGDPFRIGHSYKVLGDLHRLRQSWQEAMQAYSQALEVFEESHAVSNAAMVMHDLANVFLRQGRLDQAKTLLDKAVDLYWSEGNRHGVKETLLGYGMLAIALEEIETAFLILISQKNHINQPAVSFYPASQRDHAAALEKIQAALPESRLPALRVRGMQLSLEETIELGQALPVEKVGSAPTLTPRQLEVAALIAKGMSNGEIADRLVISKRTVEKHIANILSRLNVRNRVDIVRWAMENGLTQ